MIREQSNIINEVGITYTVLDGVCKINPKEKIRFLLKKTLKSQQRLKRDNSVKKTELKSKINTCWVLPVTINRLYYSKELCPVKLFILHYFFWWTFYSTKEP